MGPLRIFFGAAFHWHRWVIFKLKYLSKFEVTCENTPGCEKGIQGDLFDGKKQKSKSYQWWSLILKEFHELLIASLFFLFINSSRGFPILWWIVKYQQPCFKYVPYYFKKLPNPLRNLSERWEKTLWHLLIQLSDDRYKTLWDHVTNFLDGCPFALFWDTSEE